MNGNIWALFTLTRGHEAAIRISPLYPPMRFGGSSGRPVPPLPMLAALRTWSPATAQRHELCCTGGREVRDVGMPFAAALRAIVYVDHISPDGALRGGLAAASIERLTYSAAYA